MNVKLWLLYNISPLIDCSILGAHYVITFVSQNNASVFTPLQTASKSFILVYYSCRLRVMGFVTPNQLNVSSFIAIKTFPCSHYTLILSSRQ